MVVFGYVRVSTESQLENYSIEEQTERLKSYCKAKDWVMAKIYTDGGYSGGNTDRPALRQLLKDLRTSKVDAVIVYKLDRLSRNQKDTLTLIEDSFLKNNVDFISVNENFDTSTPFGRAMIGILSVFAQLEKDQITERFTMGRIGRGKAGYFHGGGNSPFGYKYENGELIIDEYRAAQVREVYDKLLSGKSINAITRDMSLRYDEKWHTPRVRNILLNSIYIGKVKFSGVEYQGNHPPIVSIEAFNEVQRLLVSIERENKKNSAQKTPFRAGFLLSGLVYCSRCGARYHANHGYYKCYSRAKSCRKYIIDPNCDNSHWVIGELNSKILEEINDVLQDKSLVNEMLSNNSNEVKVDCKAIRKQIRDADKQIERLIQLYQVSGIPIEDITRRVNVLTQEKRFLEDKLNAGASGSENKREMFMDALSAFHKRFDGSEPETQRLLIGSLIQSINVDGYSVSVNWRI